MGTSIECYETGMQSRQAKPLLGKSRAQVVKKVRITDGRPAGASPTKVTARSMQKTPLGLEGWGKQPENGTIDVQQLPKP